MPRPHSCRRNRSFERPAGCRPAASHPSLAGRSHQSRRDSTKQARSRPGTGGRSSGSRGSSARTPEATRQPQSATQAKPNAKPSWLSCSSCAAPANHVPHVVNCGDITGTLCVARYSPDDQRTSEPPHSAHSPRGRRGGRVCGRAVDFDELLAVSSFERRAARASAHGGRRERRPYRQQRHASARASADDRSGARAATRQTSAR